MYLSVHTLLWNGASYTKKNSPVLNLSKLWNLNHICLKLSLMKKWIFLNWLEGTGVKLKPFLILLILDKVNTGRHEAVQDVALIPLNKSTSGFPHTSLSCVSPHSLGIGFVLFIVTHLEEGQLCFIGWKKNRHRGSTVRPNGIYTKNFAQPWPKLVCLIANLWHW